MQIETIISDKLWEAIHKSYEAGNFTNAITDGILFLFGFIREQTGLNADGDALITEAFSVLNPLIKINNLETQTEKDVQIGTMMIFQGIYKSIRNPRNHEKIRDDEKTATQILVFLDYLFSQICNAETPFIFTNFLNEVTDKFFVQTAEYAREITVSIPQNKKLDALIELFHHRQTVDVHSLILVVEALFQQLKDSQQNDFKKILNYAQTHESDFSLVALTFTLAEPQDWASKDNRIKLRMEKIISKSLEEAKTMIESNDCNEAGALVTWAIRFLGFFESKADVRKIIVNKLQGLDTEKDFVFRWLLHILPKLFVSRAYSHTILSEIASVVNTDFGPLKAPFDLLESAYYHYPEDWRNEINRLIPDSKKWNELPF